MTTIPATGLLVASLFTATAPESDRVKTLAPFFNPSIGTEISIETDLIPARQRKAHPEQLSGTIIVTPPKGHCFTITKRTDLPDILVCAKKYVKFSAEDLNPDGSLTWHLSTGPADAGTTLMWPSGIRRGKAVDLTMTWPGPSRAVFLNRCDAQETFDHGRRIFLRLLSGERWVIVLPKEDTLIKQPIDAPNLYVGDDLTVKKGVVVDVLEETPTHLNVRLVYPEQKAQQKLGNWVDTWQAHPRNAHEMSADGFIPDGTQTPGMRGKCWYKYSGYPKDPTSGLLECHDVTDYRWLFLPLTCIGDLRID